MEDKESPIREIVGNILGGLMLAGAVKLILAILGY